MHLYPKDTAGFNMVESVPMFSPDTTVSECYHSIISNSKRYVSLNYIYIIDHTNSLLGVLSLKDLFNAKEPHIKVSMIMKKDIISVHPYSHQEKAALLALENNIKAIPVLEKDDKFLGVVDSDRILSIMHEELSEDIYKLAGHMGKPMYAHPDNVLKMPLKNALLHRLPWLVIGLLGGLLSAQIVSGFEEVLSKNIILASFIPLIVYIADAVGTQMEAFVIRDMSLYTKLNIVSYIQRQFIIVSLIGTVLSSLTYVISLILYNLPKVSVVLSLALFCATISSLFSGLLIPFMFSKFKQDPANASGPVATIIQDLLSVLVYFFVARLLL